MKRYSGRTATAVVAGALSMCVATAGDEAEGINSPGARIELQSVVVDPSSGLVTLRWHSEEGRSYAIEETVDPERGWVPNVTEVPGDWNETTLTILPQPAHAGAQAMLFRVREATGNLTDKGSADAGKSSAPKWPDGAEVSSAPGTVRTGGQEPLPGAEKPGVSLESIAPAPGAGTGGLTAEFLMSLR